MPRRARAVIDEAIALTVKTSLRMDQMQALTVKGDLCAAASQEDDAVACWHEAIAIARQTATRSMELRAATRLARLRRRQGRIAEARAPLADVYHWFTEGFDTPDLRDARTLLELLDRPAPRGRPKTRRSSAATSS
jgi:hypothetical protein